MASLTEFDWNFNGVPDEELVACCYWEYARESAFIRGLRKRSWDYWRPLYLKPEWWNAPRNDLLEKDLEKVRSIGMRADVILSGIASPPDGELPDFPPVKPGEVERATGSFPKPWQALTPQERDYRAIVPPHYLAAHVPFARGMVHDAKYIVEQAYNRVRERHKANEQVRREHPGVPDERLFKMGKLKFPEIDLRLIHESGIETTIVEIDWASFTNEQIIQCFRRWVKAERPPHIPKPNDQGNKRISDRVRLERLGILRLLHRFTLAELRKKSPAAWKRYNSPNRRWHKDAEKARGHFRELFPFLPKEETPVCWPPKA